MISRWWWAPKTGGELWPKDRSVRSFDGTCIRYTVLGAADGPVVTMCAGFLCPDTYWRYLVPRLTDRFRVIVWNYRGIGVSGLPRDPGFHAIRIRDEDLTIEANALDLLGILEQEGIDRTALVGHSMGAQTIFEVYRQAADRVAGLVPIAGTYRSPLRTFYGTDIGSRLAPVGLPLMHALPRTTLVAWRTLLRSPVAYPLARLSRGMGARARRGDMDGYFEHLATCDPLIAAKMIRGMHHHTAEDLLGSIDVPTLVVHGTKDPFAPPRIAREMADRISGAELLMIPGGSHTLPIEDPAAIGARLRPFLAGCLGVTA